MGLTHRFLGSPLLLSFCCLLFEGAVQAQVCNPPGCWPGKYYKFDVVAKSGDVTAAGTFTGFGDEPSINDKGTVAFVGQIGAGNFEGVFTQDLPSQPVWITQGFSSSGRTFGRAVQINNLLQIVARDGVPGSPPPSLVRIWQGNASGVFTTIARGGFATDPFASVFAQPGINSAGQVVFSALDQSFNSLLATPNSALNPPFNETFLNTPLRPVIDDNGFVIVRNGSLDTNSIVRYDNSLVNLTSVADTTTDFSAVGMSPGVSRDGVVVAFAGNMTAAGAALWGTNPGPGIFIAIIQNNSASRIIRVAGYSAPAPVAGVSCTAAAGVLGTKCIENMNAFPAPAGTNWDGYCDPGETCKAVGEIEDNPPAAAGGAPVPVYFKTFDPAQFAASSAEWEQRIGVIHTDFGAPGLDADTIVVSFVATPNVASALHLFSANSGLWTVQVDLKLVAGSIIPKVHKPMPVLQVGDKLGSATTVTAISVFDPISVATVDELGIARTPLPGEHEVAFWVSTSANTQMILRGTHEDTDGDGLLDHWEEYGIDFDGDGTIDLDLSSLDSAAPPDIKHKDLYIEVDYMCTGVISADAASCAVAAGQHTHQPGMNPYTGNPLAVATLPIARVIAAFNAAPVTNPDGVNGINLHVQVDEAIQEVANILWNAPATTVNSFQNIKVGTAPCSGHFGTVLERADANCVNILGARSLSVRYDLFGDQFNGAANSGVAKLRGNDFIVTLAVAPKDPNPCTKSDFANWAQCLANTWATTMDAEWADLQASTFMHEGGHSLGLFHGGNDLFANYKPNYISIMNYSFQFTGAGFASFNMAAPDCKVIGGGSQCRTNRTLDYSRGPALGNLNEAALSEAAGIGAPAGVRTLWYVPVGANFAILIGLGSGPLDWDGSGAINGAPLGQDINKSGATEVLTGHDDWSNLTYGFRESPELSLGAQLTLPVVPEADIFDYQALTIPTVTLTGGGPVITLNPANQTVTDGSTVSFTAAASGTPSPTVQWQLSTNGGATFNNIAGATATTLSFTAALAQNGTQVRAVFTNTAGSATTNAATLTVNAATVKPTVTLQPSDQTVTDGSTVSFTAAASGTPSPTVQWQLSTNGGATFNNIAGATATTLSFTTVLTQNGTQVRAVFTNTAGSATTNAATLTVNPATVKPTVTLQPSNQTVTDGSTVSFTATASGTPSPTVQWQLSTNGGATFNNIAGATATTLSFTTVLTQNGTQVRAVFTNTAGSATTNAATLTVNAATVKPTVTLQPSNQTVTDGSTVSFTAAASGTPSPTVQWQLSTNGGATFNNIAGATATTLSFTTVLTQNGTQVRAVFTNTAGSATTNAATLTVTSVVSCVNNLSGRGTPSGIAPARIDLTWSGIPNVAYYNVLRSTTPGGPYQLIGKSSGTGYSDRAGLTNNTTYYYVLQPFAATGTQICQSNQATITIPVGR